MNGKTRVCGVIGCPVEHSMSPQMHNFYAERTGLNLAYVPFRVEPQAVGDAVKGAYALNLLGLNVTVPHKQRVMEYLVEIDEDARAIGAVNKMCIRDRYGTSLSPIITQVMQIDSVAVPLRFVMCIVVGVVIGFVLPPLATHVHYAHKGYSLYNVGFASGIIATVIVSLLKSFGIETKARQIWATGYDHCLLYTSYRHQRCREMW